MIKIQETGTGTETDTENTEKTSDTSSTESTSDTTSVSSTPVISDNADTKVSSIPIISDTADTKKNKKKDDICVHVKSSTHERLLRRKKDAKQPFNSVIVELLEENIELKRKLRSRNGYAEKANEDQSTIGNQAKAE